MDVDIGPGFVNRFALFKLRTSVLCYFMGISRLRKVTCRGVRIRGMDRGSKKGVKETLRRRCVKDFFRKIKSTGVIYINY